VARPFVTLVVCSIDAGRYERCTRRYRQLLAPADHEVIGIHDAASLASAYNWAARRASGELVVFSHDDVEIVSPDLVPALRRAMASLGVIGVAGTSRVVDAYWPRAGPPHLHGWMAARGRTATRSTSTASMPRSRPASKRWTGCSSRRRPRCSAGSPSTRRPFDGFHGYDVGSTFSAHRAGFRSARAPRSPRSTRRREASM
jgi:hypothetical protein